MPKQVWQADDGKTFESKDECFRYDEIQKAEALKFEKCKKDIGEILKGYLKDVDSEKRLGLQRGFGDNIRQGFSEDFKEVWKWRKSFITFAKLLEG